jgi:hypothetical protein
MQLSLSFLFDQGWKTASIGFGDKSIVGWGRVGEGVCVGRSKAE